jgi:uncharacterized protein YceH (UPF0502 family)
VHLLSGAAESVAVVSHEELRSTEGDRIGRLEDEVIALRRELIEVQRQLGEFRKQFE